MSVTLTLTERFSVLGYELPSKTTVTADGSVSKTAAPGPAKTGQLTTRTDANTGTLTMDSGHGITTGARLDLYWDGGIQRGITVGTVSGDSVPFDLGVGDDLPVNNTDITAMVPTEEEFLVTGDNAGAVIVYSTVAGMIVFAEADETEIAAYPVGGGSGENQTTVWTPARNATNPLDSGTITKVYFSHGSSTETASMMALVLIN